MEKTQNKGIKLSVKSFIISIVIMLLLMIVAYLLTFFLKAGEYSHIINDKGNTVIETTLDFPLGKYQEIEKDFPFYKFIASPILVFTMEGSTTLIGIIVFLFIIGGTFQVLGTCNLMEYILKKIVNKYYNKRYLLLAVIILFFMLLGSLVGSFEEVIPIVPFMVLLASSLGFDEITGIAVSFLAVGCGFSTAIMNPFTVGIAQEQAGVAMFSGVWMRIVSFIIIYILLTFWVLTRVKKKKNNEDNQEINHDFTKNEKLDKASASFGIIIVSAIFIVISSVFIPFLRDYTLIIFGLAFLLAGIISGLQAGLSLKELLKIFLKGMIGMAPVIILILMASSIKYILTESSRIDTILYLLINLIEKLPKWSVILFIYLIVLIFNFFISSGSAKAFLLMPLLTPIASIFNIPINLVILAYIFGDGFSNMLYPTNAALLITLNVTDVSYSTYFKKTISLFLSILVITAILLLFGLVVNYH